MIDQPRDELAIFRIAYSIQSDELREEYLRQMCGDNAWMRDRVVQLLQASAEAPQFLECPPTDVGNTVDFPPIAERPGTRIGPYKLVQEIGEGGMGIVYMAAQQEPVRRKVALKIIKPGMDTCEVIARFAAEKQALAIMDHPNIAKVHDAGTTESGRPYFVMELVNGVTLTQYCDDNNLTTHQRLELFVSVCHAVQHAHQKGIIHRDIKPSNILVTLHDGVPVPKIIDFGIAKAINQELTSTTTATGPGNMIGTPLYMSPEQAETSGLDIDTRSDIYSLGVLLYELLTGSTPFDREQLKDAGLDEVRRLIREQEPQRPSTRISTLGKAATTVSEHRKTDPVELSNSLRHELDWIVMKALEKDRTRRYETANDFARDIQRYLHNEAVEACPPSKVYRLRKFTRRHQTAAIATAAVSLALILGAGAATGQAIRATKAEKVAEEQLRIAQEQQRLAKQQTQLAQKQKRLAEESAQRERDLRTEAEAARKQSEKATDFLVEIFRSPDPILDSNAITVEELLDQARNRIETNLKDDALLQAKLLAVIGTSYFGRGHYQQAAECAKKSYDIYHGTLGPKNVSTLQAMHALADAYRLVGRTAEAVSLLIENVQFKREVLGPEHLLTLGSMASLGRAYDSNHRFDEAISLQEETLRLRTEGLGLEHEDTLESMSFLAMAYLHVDRNDEGLRLLERAFQIQKTTWGLKKQNTLRTMVFLASALGRAGKWNESIALLEEALPLLKAKLGPTHCVTLEAMNLLGGIQVRRAEYAAAEPLLLEAYQGFAKRQAAGSTPYDDQQAQAAVTSLVQLYEKSNQPDKAKEWKEKLDALKSVAKPEQ